MPLARVVAEYRAKLPKFFKRYQVQPVWRADRPQKGRFREFYQCDVDAIGSTSMVVEAELLAAAADVLSGARLHATSASAQSPQAAERGCLTPPACRPSLHGDALVALDKVDKIGGDGVRERAGRARASPDGGATRCSSQLCAGAPPADRSLGVARTQQCRGTQR